MKFIIDEKIFIKYPGLNIGLITFRDIDNQGIVNDILDLIKERSNEIRLNFTEDDIKNNEKLMTWRVIYSSFGAKPKKYKCSVENLYRMIINNVELSHINKVVDIYNYISLKYMVPIGGDDIDSITGDIILTLADGTEKFIQLNSTDITYPKEGEVIYKDNEEVLCRRWNWRECDKSKMTPATKNITLVIEGLSPITETDVVAITQELADLVTKYCGGEYNLNILNKNKTEININ